MSAEPFDCRNPLRVRRRPRRRPRRCQFSNPGAGNLVGRVWVPEPCGDVTGIDDPVLGLTARRHDYDPPEPIRGPAIPVAMALVDDEAPQSPPSRPDLPP